MIRYYPKINAPLARDSKGHLLSGQWVDPAFAEHQDSLWYWYYKWDGTNVGMTVDGWFGRSENSMFTTEQADCLDNWYMNRRDSLHRSESGLEHLYGELVGPGVQGNPHDWLYLRVVEFERWSGEPVPYGARTEGTLNEMLVEHRERAGRFGPHDFYIEGFVGRLAADPSIVTKIKARDRWAI